MPESVDDALTASVSLIGHTGATGLTFGYLHDDVPTEKAAWWATATYRGAKVTVENRSSPLEALEAIAERLLTGARCKWCQGLVALSLGGAVAFPGSIMVDGSRMPTDPVELAALGQCLWRRNGRRWEPGCIHGASTADGAPTSRAGRRRLARQFEATRPGAGG